MPFRKSGDTTSVGFEPRTFSSFMTGKTLNYSVSADWDLKPGPLAFVYKGSIPHTEIKPFSTTHTKTKSISMQTLKPSDLRARIQTKPMSTTHTKTKSIDHNPKNKSISACTQSITTPRTKNKSISIPTLKRSKIRSPTQNSS